LSVPETDLERQYIGLATCEAYQDIILQWVG